jgi:hypothetical protein
MKLLPRLSHRSISTKSGIQRVKQWEEYCDSELIPVAQRDRVSKTQSILALVKNLWYKAVAALTEGQELKIWQTQDRYGHIHWNACDPCTGKSASFTSESAMLSWIDNLHR